MSFEALLWAVEYARFEIVLDACHEAVVRIQRKTALDATKGQIEDDTPSCRQHQVPSQAKCLVYSFKPSPSSVSLSTRSHPPTIDMSEFLGLVTKIPKNWKKERLRNWSIREDRWIKMLRAELLTGTMPDRVWCKECESWIGLDKRRRYCPEMWKRHHSPGGRHYETIQKHLRETGEKIKLFVPKRSNCDIH